MKPFARARRVRPALLVLSGVLPLFFLFACGGGYDRDDHRTPTDPGSQFLVLTAEGDAALPADGVTRLRLAAHISADAVNRTIQFITTAGSLVGGTGSDATLREVTVDSSGLARIELQSPLTPGTALVTARVKDVPQVAQSLSVTFVDPGPDALLQVTAAPAVAPADGATASRLTVRISPRIAASDRNVRFQTNLGSFAPGAAMPEITVPARPRDAATEVMMSPHTVASVRPPLSMTATWPAATSSSQSPEGTLTGPTGT